jgi:hypothetical protein
MKKIIQFTILLILMVTASCSMKQEILLEKSGQGEFSFKIVLAPYLGEVLDQVQMLMNSEPPLPENGDIFFDLDAIRNDFSKNKSVNLVELISPDRLSLEGRFLFDSIEEMLQKVEKGSAESQMIHFKSYPDRSELTVNISRDSMESLIKANPGMNNPLVENFGPSATEGLSSGDYLDMMEFALGEESRLGIQNSRLAITVKVQGRILEQTGGKKLDDKSVLFEIPLLDVLMLKKSLTYTLSYN